MAETGGRPIGDVDAAFAGRYVQADGFLHVLAYGAAHQIGADRPEALAGLVSDFLERREQFEVARASGLLHP